MGKHRAESGSVTGRRPLRRLASIAAVAAIVVGVVDGVAGASSSTSEGIVSITPHSLASGASVGAAKSVSYVVSGGSTTVPTDATRVQLSVTVSNQQQAGTLTSQPYLDAADASGDTLSWAAPKTTVSGTFLEPVGVSNKVSFTNTSAGTVTVAVKITGYSTSARLATRLDVVESNQGADETAIGNLQSAVASLTNQLDSAQQTITQQGSTITQQGDAISSLSSRLATDEDALQALPRVEVSSSPGGTGSWNLHISGANLLPGSTITAHYLFNGNPTSASLATVGSDGTANASPLAGCGVTNLYVTGSDMASNSIASNRVVKGAGCP